MKILFYSINYKPELTGIGKYQAEMAEWFADNGHEVKVITAPPYYPDWKIKAPYKNCYNTVVDSGVTVHRAPLYVPKKPSVGKRIIYLCSFSISSIWWLIRLRRFSPDVVFLVEPTLFCAPATIIYAKAVGAKSVLHVQDYEIEAMLGLGMINESALSKIARNIERSLLGRFDFVSSISKSMVDMAVKKGVKPERMLYLPNWVDTDFIKPEADRTKFRKLWGITAETRVVLYSGNIGKKQGMEMILEAAKKMRHRTDTLFLLVGQGAMREELEKTAVSAQLTNVRFESLQAYKDLSELLAVADVHLVIQKRGAADVVLPSKLTSILSAGGHALITADPDTELGSLVAEFPGIATLVEPESLDDFCRTLHNVLDNMQTSHNDVARSYAIKYLNKNEVLGRFSCSLQDAVNWRDSKKI
jgi:colanic acid biosynthesis glycosyl transferase WcaI